MEIVCDCANARVVGEGHLGAKPLDGSDPVEQAEKIAQARQIERAKNVLSPDIVLCATPLIVNLTPLFLKHFGGAGRTDMGFARVIAVVRSHVCKNAKKKMYTEVRKQPFPAIRVSILKKTVVEKQYNV